MLTCTTEMYEELKNNKIINQMAEISLTIRTTKPEEAAKLADLIRSFFGQDVQVTSSVKPEDIKVNLPVQAPAAPVATEGKKLDAGFLREKVASFLKNAELMKKVPTLREQILEKVASYKVKSVSSI